MEPRRRGSRSSQSSRIQSLWARANAAARYELPMSETVTPSSPVRTPISTPCWSRTSRWTCSTSGSGKLPRLVLEVLPEPRARMRPGVARGVREGRLGAEPVALPGSMNARNSLDLRISWWMSQSIRRRSLTMVLQGDCNRLAADPACALAREEGDHVSNLLGGDDSAGRVLSHSLAQTSSSVMSRRSASNRAGGLGHLGANPARKDGVAGNFVAPTSCAVTRMRPIRPCFEAQ